MSDLATKQLIAQLSERLRALQGAARPLPYERQVSEWTSTARWAERDVREIDELIDVLTAILDVMEQ